MTNKDISPTYLQRASPKRRVSRHRNRRFVIRTVLSSLALAAVVLTVAVDAHAGPPPTVERALRNASSKWGVSYYEMRAVSFCESRWNPRAVGYGSHGLFQFLRSTFAHTPYWRHDIYDPWWNALAAAWLVRHDGSWRQWTCQPW